MPTEKPDEPARIEATLYAVRRKSDGKWWVGHGFDAWREFREAEFFLIPHAADDFLPEAVEIIPCIVTAQVAPFIQHEETNVTESAFRPEEPLIGAIELLIRERRRALAYGDDEAAARVTSALHELQVRILEQPEGTRWEWIRARL